MDSLSMATVRKLMLAVERIYSVSNLESFGPEVFAAIAEFIPDSFVSLEQVSLTTGEVSSVTSDEARISAEVGQRIIELLPSHPAMPRVKAGVRGAICLTDCLTQREFRNSAYYADVMVPVGVEYQTVVPLDIPGHIAGITVNRGANFTDKDSTFLTLLAPHLAMASGKLKRLETLQKALDSIPFPTPEQLQQVGFTPRESEILFWVMQGKRDSEIADILSEKRKVSLRTINNHLRHILAKTNAETRTGACLDALERIKNRLSEKS
jgi:DNA-binding CsgD family transcriptional regulator